MADKRKIIAVYQLFNLRNNKAYVGSTINYAGRRRQHLYDMRRGRHVSKVQEDYNLYGEDAFTFFVLEVLPSPDNLLEREQFWIDKIKPEYNSNEFAGQHFGAYIYTEDAMKTKYEKIAAKLRGRKRGIIHWKNGPPTLGKKLTDAERKHLSEINIGERNPNFGLKRSEETKAKIRAKAIKTYPGVVSPDGIVFAPIHNLREFCKEHDLRESTMYSVMSGKIHQHKGWKRVEDKCG